MPTSVCVVKLWFTRHAPWGLHLWREEITEINRLREELLTYVSDRLWPDPSEAEDFVQLAFERLFKRSGVKDTRALLYKIVNGLLMNEYRDRQRRPADESLERLAWDGDAFEGLDHLEQFQSPSAEDVFFASAFDQAVRDLDDDSRDAFILGELRGLTCREAGEVLDVSWRTANVRRTSATAQIKEQMCR